MKHFKIALKICLYLVTALGVLLIIGLIYILIPTDSSLELKELQELEESMVTPKPQALKKKKTQKKVIILKHEELTDLSPECRDSYIDIRRSSIDEIKHLLENEKVLFSKKCIGEIDTLYSTKYSEQIEDTCYGIQKIKSLAKRFDPDTKSNPERDKSELVFSDFCTAGAAIYRKELNQYYDQNLREIDQFARFTYLKAMAKMKGDDLPSFMMKNTMKKMGFIKELIRLGITMAATMEFLKDYAESGSPVEELNFENSEIRSFMMEALKSDENLIKITPNAPPPIVYK